MFGACLLSVAEIWSSGKRWTFQLVMHASPVSVGLAFHFLLKHVYVSSTYVSGNFKNPSSRGRRVEAFRNT